MRRIVWGLLILLMCGVTVEAATRYAAQNGSGTACTVQGTPCTVSTALSQAVSGDTVSLLSSGGNFTSLITVTSKTNLLITGNGTAHLTTTSGECLIISGGSNVTVQAMDIGTCGASDGSGNGQAVRISGGSGHKLYDNYIHTEIHTNSTADCNNGGCDRRTNILVENGATGVEIQGNVIYAGETNIQMQGDGGQINGVTIHGNYLLNPRGPFPRGQHTQSSKSSAPFNANITITSNYAHCRNTLLTPQIEDHINFWGSTDNLVENNYIDSTGCAAFMTLSGTAMINDHQGQRSTFRGNKVKATGHVGLSATVGFNHDFDNNRIFIDNQVEGFIDPDTATGISVFPNDGPCGDIQIRNNVTYLRQNDGTLNAYFNGGCSNVTQTNETRDAAALAILTAGGTFYTAFPPPLIPPIPRNCTAVSPYSTQTSHGSCAAAAAGPSFTFTASSPVISGATSTLTWSAVTGSPTSCTASVISGQADTVWSTAGGNPTSAQLIAGGNKQSTARTANTTYRMSCTDGVNPAVVIDQPVVVSDGTPPATPTGLLVASTSSSRLSLDWNANGEGDLAGYRVYECQGSCTPSVLRADVALLSDFVARGLLGNTPYCYRVTAYDTTNNESALASSPIVCQTTQTIPAGAPELYLSFEEGVGTAVYDESGHAHNSTAFNGTFSGTAQSGSFSASLNGAQSARIPRTTALEPAAVTLATWVRRSGVQPSFAVLFRKTWQDNTAPTFASYNLSLNSGGGGSDLVRCEMGTSGLLSGVTSAAGAIPDLTWTHVACTFDPAGVAPQLKLYVNAQLSGTPLTDTAAILYDTTATGDFYVGQNGASAEFMTGLVDEVRLYPRVLTLGEIQTLAGVGDTLAPAAPANLRVVSP